MRSIRLMAATTVIVSLASACGDGGSDLGNPPVAIFTAPSCTADTPCQFTDASTPVGGISTWNWTFGDNTAADPAQNPAHTYAEPGTYTVTLTVTNNDGTNSKSNQVTVSGGTNQSPVASFTAPTCAPTVACTFTSTSSDADGQITLTRWDFGDLTPAVDGTPVNHTYTAAGTFNVILTVTDNLGATNSVTLPVIVSPPAAQNCVGTSATDVTCTISLAQRSSVKITLASEDCEIGNNTVLIPPPEPRAQIVFANVCNQPVPLEYTLVDPAGAELILEAGTQLPIVFRRGSDPVAIAPQARFTTSGTNSWSISVDDGGNPTGPGEPDFADVVLTVTATAR